MTARLIAPLREAPATVPALGALALMAVWASDQAGYPLTHWAPGGLVVLVLLGIALVAARPRLAEIPVPVLVAVGCLAAYTALSFLSILWAGVPGDAWEGADRTLLYLLVFALFACWPQRGATAALLLCAWTLAVIALALFAVLHLNAAAGSVTRLAALAPGGRLTYPAGYANADAAQWLIAFWPALLIARSRRLPWGLRGVLAGGAVLLAGVALLSQSRGALYATPVMLVLVFALLPGRVRTFALLIPVAAGIAAAAPAVLRVGDRLSALEADGSGATAALHSATTAVHGATAAILFAALAVGVVVAAGAAVESRHKALSPSVEARVHRGVGALAIVLLVGLLVGGWAAAGDPLARARHAWDTFKSPSGYGANSHTGSRLTSGLGSSRYDFYRVALDEFVAHPVGGIGADNFAEPYLEHGRSDETPHYPHSVELRTLVETGLIGALLAVVGMGAALLAAWRAIVGSPDPSRRAVVGSSDSSGRRVVGSSDPLSRAIAGSSDPSGRMVMRSPDPLGRAVAAAAVAGFVYWVVHGSFDWFWEFAGLGAPAFALLGLACALAPRKVRAAVAHRASTDRPTPGPSAGGAPLRLPRPGWVPACVALAGAIALLAAIASFTAPWLSRLQVQSAAHVWVRSPQQAYARLNDAARLNPLGDEPYVVAGSIALRRGELGRADREFALGLGRTPGDAYATLERGAIASARGERHRALELLARAVHLNPRDPLTREALALARSGRTVDIGELNRSILSSARQFS
jgi:hypothetical protein